MWYDRSCDTGGTRVTRFRAGDVCTECGVRSATTAAPDEDPKKLACLLQNTARETCEAQFSWAATDTTALKVCKGQQGEDSDGSGALQEVGADGGADST